MSSSFKKYSQASLNRRGILLISLYVPSRAQVEMARALSMLIESFLWQKEYHTFPRKDNSLSQKPTQEIMILNVKL